ncbi:MAG: IS66-like element accessory protein TnpA [Steroidobacteraceae bacterium]
MSAHSQRIEVITRGERRRRWSVEGKRAIVEESLAPNALVMAVARKHGIGTGQLYKWRRQLLGRAPGNAACFARAEIAEQPRRLAGPATSPPIASAGLIEIVLPGGATVRVDALVDEHALRRVLAVLHG